MNYYNIQYIRGEHPIGRYYTVRSEKEYKAGDLVRLYGGKKAVVVGDGDLEYAQRVGDEGLISVTGLYKEEE